MYLCNITWLVYRIFEHITTFFTLLQPWALSPCIDLLCNWCSVLPGGRRIYYLLSLYTRLRKGEEPTTTDGQHCTAMGSATIHVTSYKWEGMSDIWTSKIDESPLQFQCSCSMMFHVNFTGQIVIHHYNSIGWDFHDSYSGHMHCTHAVFISLGPPRKVHETLASMDFNSFTEYYKKKRCSKVEVTRVVHHFCCCTRMIIIWLISVPQKSRHLQSWTCSVDLRFCGTCFETLSECRTIWLMLAF